MSKFILWYSSWVLLLSLIVAPGAFGNPTTQPNAMQKLQRRQSSTTSQRAGICTYSMFQSIFMHDRVFVDGGLLYYIVNGTTGTQASVGLDFPTNLSYINLNNPFDFSKETVEEKLNLFTPVTSSQGRANIMHGALLGDEYSWIQYGGLKGGFSVGQDGSSRSKSQCERFDFKKDPANPTEAWAGDSHFNAPLQLPDDVTNWVYAGAVARSPCDKKSWWFSGTRGNNWGEVYLGYITADRSPAALSNYLITADFSSQQVPKVTNTTLDSSISPRAGASMVFLPVGEQGILAVVGGVDIFDPVWLVAYGATNYTNSQLKTHAAASRRFLQTIDIYDIASGKWYSQNTTGQIPSQPISAACAVAASPDDRSSHNIYFYGGHGGLSYKDTDPGSQINTKFYVLTLPYFRWIEVLSPSSKDVTGRALHQCHRVQSDQMLVVGGHPTANNQNNNGLLTCAMYPGPGPAMIFNLNTCEVQNDGWDPTKRADYRVPDKVVAVIGGSGTGGATKKDPEAGWSDDGLKELFSNPTAYKQTATPSWIYTPSSTSSAPPGSSSTATSTQNVGGTSIPSYIKPLLGTLLGLFGLITILSLTLFIIRRRKQKRALDAPSETEGSTVRKNKQTWSWLLGVYGDDKSSRGAHQRIGHRNSDDLSGTGTGTGTTLMHGDSSGRGSEANRESVMSPISPVTERSDPVVELQGKTIHEMPDTSVPQELEASYPGEKNTSRTSLKKEGRSVRYEDEQTPALAGDSSTQAQGASRPPGHRKLSSLDYPE